MNIIAMLHNVKLNRYHPIFFLYNPTPSGIERWKSKVHHTEGFDNREDALKEATGGKVKDYAAQFGESAYCLEKDFPWDGEDLPAMVTCFVKNHEGNYV